MNDINALVPQLKQALATINPGADSRRLIHGRGKTIPGCEQVNVDWFEPVLLITLYEPINVKSWPQVLTPLLMDRPLVAAVLVQHRYEKTCPTGLAFGQLPGDFFAKRGHLQFHLSFFKQQNVGFFLDMEPGRQWLEQRCAGKSVLNLFAYTCAFSAVAADAGAGSVVNVDMSSAALSMGRKNHEINGLVDCNVSYMKEDILKSWGRIRKRGPYDIVIFDPPSFQKGSFIAAKDYAKLVRRIPQLCAPQADVLACLNAPELGEDFIESIFDTHIPGMCTITRLESHEDFPDIDPDRSLKLFHCRYRAN